MKKLRPSIKIVGMLFILIVILPLAITVLSAWHGYNGRILALDVWTSTESGALITRRDLLDEAIYLTRLWGMLTVVILSVAWVVNRKRK